jgi:hypothetical protein
MKLPILGPPVIRDPSPASMARQLANDTVYQRLLRTLPRMGPAVSGAPGAARRADYSPGGPMRSIPIWPMATGKVKAE